MTARTKLGFEEKNTKQGEKVRKEPKERRVGLKREQIQFPDVMNASLFPLLSFLVHGILTSRMYSCVHAIAVGVNPPPVYAFFPLVGVPFFPLLVSWEKNGGQAVDRDEFLAPPGVWAVVGLFLGKCLN